VIRILIHGAGKMGHRLLARLPEFENCELAGVIAIPGSEDNPPTDCYGSLDEFKSGADLLIDFTLRGGTQAAAEWCERNGVALISGTTGLSIDDEQALQNAAEKVPVLWAPNLSHGVALITSLVRQAASALGVDAAIHVAETHHVHKIDAPSGTALALAKSAMEGRGEQLGELLETGPLEYSSGGENGPDFSSTREGEVVGEHTVSFTLPEEVIEISHKALDRDIFAKGALKAGEWLVRQPPGYYSTSDWLGLD